MVPVAGSGDFVDSTYIQPERKVPVDRDSVYALCKTIAPKYGYIPLMVLAQIEQESSYQEGAIRLEEGFLVKYVEPHPTLGHLAPCVQVLMASSFGFGQLMGESLYEIGYFFALDTLSVAMKLDEYVGSPDQQIDTMCKFLQKKQAAGTDHSLDAALTRYNGSSDYPSLVYARFNKLKGIYNE
jgi:hypothetical protein